MLLRLQHLLELLHNVCGACLRRRWHAAASERTTQQRATLHEGSSGKAHLCNALSLERAAPLLQHSDVLLQLAHVLLVA